MVTPFPAVPTANYTPAAGTTAKGLVINFYQPYVTTGEEAPGAARPGWTPPLAQSVPAASGQDVFNYAAPGGQSPLGIVPGLAPPPANDQLAQAYAAANLQRQQALKALEDAENARQRYLSLGQQVNNQAAVPPGSSLPAMPAPPSSGFPTTSTYPGMPAPVLSLPSMPVSPFSPVSQTVGPAAAAPVSALPPAPVAAPIPTVPPTPSPGGAGPLASAPGVPPAVAPLPSPLMQDPFATATPALPPAPDATTAAPPATMPGMPAVAPLLPPPLAAVPPSAPGAAASAPGVMPAAPNAAPAAGPNYASVPVEALNEMILSSNPQSNELDQLAQSAKKAGGRPNFDILTKANRLQQQADAISEVAVRSGLANHPPFPKETFDRLELIANLDTRNAKDQTKDDLDYFRQTALWTLGLLNGSQNSSMPTQALPGIKTMERIARDPKESPQVRAAAVQALRAANRFNSREMLQLIDRVENKGPWFNPANWFKSPLPPEVKRETTAIRQGIPIQPASPPPAAGGPGQPSPEAALGGSVSGLTPPALGTPETMAANGLPPTTGGLPPVWTPPALPGAGGAGMPAGLPGGAMAMNPYASPVAGPAANATDTPSPFGDGAGVSPAATGVYAPNNSAAMAAYPYK